LYGIDPVDANLVIERDQALSVAAVKGGTQVAENLAVAGVGRTGVAERGKPAVAVAVGIGPIVPGGQVQDGRAALDSLEQLVFLLGHGHLYSPAFPGHQPTKPKKIGTDVTVT